MKILLIDDLQLRHNVAEELLPKAGHKLLHAFDPFEAIDYLQSGTDCIDIIMLSFSLNYFATNDQGGKTEKTGLDVVEFIANNLPQNKHPTIAIVHTGDVFGANKLITALRKLDIYTRYSPFSYRMLQKLIEEFTSQ